MNARTHVTALLTLMAVACRPQGAESMAVPVPPTVPAASMPVKSPCPATRQLDQPVTCVYREEWVDFSSGHDRSLIGNLSALGLAHGQASKWGPSPESATAFGQTWEFRAIGLWNPFTEAPGQLEGGPPPQDATPGTYWFWVDGGVPHFAAVAEGGHVAQGTWLKLSAKGWGREGLAAAERQHGMSLPVGDVPEGKADQVAYCEVLAYVAWSTVFSYPVVSEGMLPPATIGDLAEYWWLWDAEAMDRASPFPPGSVSLRGPNTSEPLVPECLGPEGSVWQWARTSALRSRASN